MFELMLHLKLKNQVLLYKQIPSKPKKLHYLK